MMNFGDRRGCQDSRVDVIESAEVFKHAVTKAHIISRLATEQTTLFCFEPA